MVVFFSPANSLCRYQPGGLILKWISIIYLKQVINIAFPAHNSSETREEPFSEWKTLLKKKKHCVTRSAPL